MDKFSSGVDWSTNMTEIIQLMTISRKDHSLTAYLTLIRS